MVGGGGPLIHMDWSSGQKVCCGRNCRGNDGRGGSTSMMSGRGRGWLAKRLMKSNNSSGDELVDLGVDPPRSQSMGEVMLVVWKDEFEGSRLVACGGVCLGG
nr:hypothetical protein [Tanacetum cinerariifolium]